MNARTLSVNLDHLATIRRQRNTPYPSLATAAGLCEIGGASGITLHLREDRRHIQDDDVELIRKVTFLPLTLEISPAEETTNFACRVLPDAVTLVPEKPGELTTEGGLNLDGEHLTRIGESVQMLKEKGIRVTLFVEPDTFTMERAGQLHADAVEIHTGPYAAAWESRNRERIDHEINRIRMSGQRAVGLGMQVNAGHGLYYQNVKDLAQISWLCEFSIGHGILSRAVFSGLADAVKEMVRSIRHRPAPGIHT